jgi:predicted ATP-dependent protease
MNAKSLEVPAARLRPHWDAAQLSFETTEELPPLEGPVGQARALAALDFGLCTHGDGFHLFVSGPPGTGRTFAVRKKLDTLTPQQPTPPDWCYLHNFHEPDRPAAVSLPPGRGRKLAQDLEQLVEECRTEIPRAFDSDTYRQRQDAIHQRFNATRGQLIEQTSRRAQELGLLFEMTPAGIATIPLRDGKPLPPEAFEQLSAVEREQIRQNVEAFGAEAETFLRGMRKVQKEEQEALEALNQEVATFAVGQIIGDLLEAYADLPRVREHLDQIRADLVKHFHDFLPEEVPPGPALAMLEAHQAEVFSRYQANVVVDNGQPGTRAAGGGAPAVFETNPTYYNLLGRTDYRAQFGAMVTDFTMVKSGALQRANGGFLVLDAQDVLRNPFAWEALTRSLRTGEACIENFGDQMGLVPTATLKPEPIPLSVKVVLIGEPQLYQLLFTLDPEFRELFRVKADFDSEVPRTPETVAGYARYLGCLCREQGLRHFHKSGVARLIEHSSRLREHQEKLTARLLELSSLAGEASFWAARENSPHVMAEHVERAIAQKEFRSNLPEEKIQEGIDDGTFFIDVAGEVVGQVNGLAVYDLGDYAFGRPARVTARTSLGSHGVVNIEREAELSGKIHSKGVMILAGYLAGKFAQDKPLALSATLAFEQSYGEVEGDSASSAELYALLSSLSGLPIRQNIAVTGSVNQRGEIQPVGGVTAKIEGFFQVCQARGLTGDQGVIMPAANVRHLALKEEVVHAVEAGQFHIWAIRTVDEGIELLTGMSAGEPGADGRYPGESVHGKVDSALRQGAERIKEFGAAARAAGTRNGRERGAPHPRRSTSLRRRSPRER